MTVTAAQLEAQSGGTNTSEFANQPNFVDSPFTLSGFTDLAVDVSALVASEDSNGGESTVEQVPVTLSASTIPADAFAFEVTDAGAWQTPLYTGQSFSCDVDWGDGTAVETMANEADPKWNHTFVGAGPHTVMITGTFGGLSTNGVAAGVVSRLIRILQNGTTGLSAQNNAYRGSALLTYKGTPGTVGTTPSIVAWFRDSADMTDCDLNGLSLANTTSLNSTFRGCTSLVNLDLTGNGIVIGSTVLSAFFGVAATTIPGIETIDTTTCTNFQDTFRDSGILVLPAWSFAAATNCTGFALNSGMTTVGPNMFDDTPCTNFTNAWSGAALTQQSIDNVLASLVAAGQSSGTLNLAVVGGVVPSAAGLVDKAILVDTRSWLVTDNTV
jgi:hypothetical protein